MARVTLTIDNGPDADVTPRVLDVLAHHRVPASFFVLGRRLLDPGLRRIAERAHDLGHWIGNHTFTHEVPFGTNDDRDAVECELEATQRALGGLGHPDRLFRPFGSGGELDSRLLSRELVEHLARHRYSCVLWNAVPRDWERPDAWVPVALEQVRALDWAVLVVHDVLPGNAAQIDRLIGQLHDEGHELVQEFPDACVPIRHGEIRAPLEAFIGR